MQKRVKNALVQQLICKIRNPDTNKREFRESLEKIGEFVALEISNYLETVPKTVRTVLGQDATHDVLKEEPILVTVLRAGIPFHYGVQRIFSEADSGFIGAQRNQETLQPEVSYVAVPDVKGKVVIIADTMLATGGSFIAAIKQIQKRGAAKIIVAAVIAAKDGVQKIQEFDNKIDIYYATIDPRLNEKGYIVPGLGDAGDRSYGLKI